MKQTFIEWNPTQNSLYLLEAIEEILDEYRGMGYKLTVRQLYYQLVSKDLIPNDQGSAKKIINIVSKGRLAGIIDWNIIEDRIRVPVENNHWKTPQDILQVAADQFYMNRWVGQEWYVEVWCEKDAVSNIIAPICKKWDVIFVANRGYSSQSAMYKAFIRYATQYAEYGKKTILLYLGDHDPSGIDMIRDVQERMDLFLYTDITDPSFSGLYVEGIALTMNQIEQYGPPENPAKTTDSRYEAYQEKFGQSSWELDALDPKTLAELVENSILNYLETGKFKKIAVRERLDKKKMNNFIKNYGSEK